MREKSAHIVWVFLAASLCLTLTGCGNSLKSKYDQIKLGMTVAEVGAIMGRKPDMHMPKMEGVTPEQMQWHSGGDGKDMWIIGIALRDGKVVYKALSKGEEVVDQQKMSQK